MTTGALCAFWAVSMLFAVTPGADWAYAIAAGMRRRAIAPAVAGMLLGHAAATLVVAAGVAALVASLAGALTALTVAGSAYLFWLAANLLVHPPLPNAEDEGAPGSWADWTISGFCVSGLNPKVFLLFLALLPQFTDPAATWAVPAQITALGAIHIVNCGAVYILVAFASQV